MIEMIAKKLKIPPQKIPYSIQKFGNSSSATIPVTICSEIRSEISEKKKRLLLSGFGAGMSIANALIDIGPCICPGIVEYDG